MNSMLTIAELYVMTGDYAAAIDVLQMVRVDALKGKRISDRLIAVHCVVGMQALLPLAVEQRL